MRCVWNTYNQLYLLGLIINKSLVFQGCLGRNAATPSTGSRCTTWRTKSLRAADPTPLGTGTHSTAATTSTSIRKFGHRQRGSPTSGYADARSGRRCHAHRGLAGTSVGQLGYGCGCASFQNRTTGSVSKSNTLNKIMFIMWFLSPQTWPCAQGQMRGRIAQNRLERPIGRFCIARVSLTLAQQYPPHLWCPQIFLATPSTYQSIVQHHPHTNPSCNTCYEYLF